MTRILTLAISTFMIAGCSERDKSTSEASSKPETIMTDTMQDANPYEGREAVMYDFACSAAEDGNHFLYVLIPGDIRPIERGDRFEDPIQESLSAADLGKVTGGGSQRGEGNTIEYCGIDVVVYDLNRGIQHLKEELARLGAPPNTVIEQYLPERLDHPVY